MHRDRSGTPSTTLPPLVVGQRFLVPEIRNLPAVELVRKSTTTWIVAEIKHDGTTDRWTFRIDKRTLAGETSRDTSSRVSPTLWVWVDPSADP